MKNCIVENCLKPVRSTNSDLCEKHYMRMYRRGSLHDRPIMNRIIASNGYAKILKKDHILGKNIKSDYLYEHRVIFYNNYGLGPHICYWCGKSMMFDKMCIDHLNEIKTDNRIDNIVPSCNACNSGRTAKKCREGIIKKQGYMITYNGETMCLEDWARKIKITSTGLKWRIDNGWSIEKALCTSSNKKNRKQRGSTKTYKPYYVPMG